MKIAFKLILILIVITLISATFFGSVSYLIIKRSFTNAVKKLADENLHTTAASIDTRLYSIVKSISIKSKTVKKMDELKQIDPKIIEVKPVKKIKLPEKGFKLEPAEKFIQGFVDTGKNLVEFKLDKDIIHLPDTEFYSITISKSGAYIKTLGVFLDVRLKKENINLAVNNMFKNYIFIFFILGVIFIYAGYYYFKDTVRQLELIGIAANKLKNGNYSARVKKVAVDESGELAESFNEMAEKLYELDALKENLTHMIVHDLKNPLTGIIGGSDVLLYSNLPEKEKKLVSIINRSGKYMLNLLKNILDISKLREEKLELKKEPADIRNLIAEVVDVVEPEVIRQKKQITFEVVSNVPRISIDRDLITRVIVNLVLNSLKYTDENTGHIAIKVYMDEGAVIEVEDNGTGIPLEHIDKIFDRFYEVSKDSKRRGTGLGLTFCKMAVEAHGGKITVASPPEGKETGTVFKIHIPL